MPLCKKCNNSFPNTAKINGKLIVLNSRKYCLDCSPFKSFNRKQLHISFIGKEKKCICIECGRNYIWSRKKGNSSVKCNSCYVNKQRKEKKQKAINLLGGKCSICGYDKCNRALEFHHLDTSKKEFTISNKSFSWEKIEKELLKCILVCANCHAEIHEKQNERLTFDKKDSNI